MCVLVFAFKTPGFGPFVLLGNRDEFYARPAEPLDFWPDHPDVMGGRDLQAGGSWLAIRSNGRLAIVTHIREGFATPAARSRGELVSEFVLGDEPALEYAARLTAQRAHYAPFNLLFGTIDDLYHYHSRTNQLSRVTPGLRTLSNATLDTPWFKTERLVGHLRAQRAVPTEADAFDWLEDATQAGPGQLPNTGIGSALERVLSPIFVVGRDYGIRASTLLTVSGHGEIVMAERSFGLAGKELCRRRYTLRLTPSSPPHP